MLIGPAILMTEPQPLLEFFSSVTILSPGVPENNGLLPALLLKLSIVLLPLPPPSSLGLNHFSLNLVSLCSKRLSLCVTILVLLISV